MEHEDKLARQREYSRKYYAANREKVNAKHKEYQQREKSNPETKKLARARQQRKRERIQGYIRGLKMGKTCTKCGFPDYRALVFHHVDPVSKVDRVSKLIGCGSLKKVQLEISKCVLLCANCHAIHHYGDSRHETT